MSFEPYGFSKMEFPNDNDSESSNAETLTSALKGMLKINGAGNGSHVHEDEGASKPEEVVEEESKKDSADEEPSVPTDTNGGIAQKIDLSQASDGECISIYGEEVMIISSPNSDINSKSSGSDKVRVKPITNFEWAHKYYNGALVAVTNNYTAYAIKTSRTSHAVRVINRKNSSDRLLLRGFSAPVCDVAFAHATSSIISAVDEDGNFLIWQLSLNGEETTAVQKLHVKQTFNDSTYHRLTWLTFMHCDIDGDNAEELLQLDPEDEPDPASHKRLLAISHGKNVEVWDINTAFDLADSDAERTEKEKFALAYMTIEHDDVISDCELSPEGSVIAIASHDGFVKFWQINIENKEEPSCLHKWKPHGDRPVSLVTFCDDRTQAQLVLYWRFMLTGCSQNSELKIWCTVSWSCLQTVSFEPSPGATEIAPALKCILNASADYLIIADVNRKVVYVLRCAANLENGKARLSSISQYLLTKSLLSFAIVDAHKCKFKNLIAMDEEGDDAEEQDGIAQESDEEKEQEDGAEDVSETNEAAKKTNGVLIKLVSITTKNIESLDIRYVPNVTDESISYTTYNTLSDELNIVSIDESFSVVSPSLDNGQLQEELKDAHRELEVEDEEADSVQNKTELIADDGDQSTIMAANEEEAQNAAKEEIPKTPERLQRAPSSPGGSLRTNLMDLLDTDESPIAHSSPSVKYTSVDPLKREEGEGEAAASPENRDPVLLTPDAFTSSLRKPEDLMSAESSFTHVTPFSVDHPSVFGSERDKSLQESTRAKSPVLPPLVIPPPGFPPIPTSTIVYKPETDGDPQPPPLQPTALLRSLSNDGESLPPMVQPASSRSSLDMALPTSSYHSILQSISVSEPGPFGDIQSAPLVAKDKSPDLITSTSSIIENGMTASSDAGVLICGPLLGAVGGSGDALFLSGKSKAASDVDADSEMSNVSKRSDHLPSLSSAPWPKAPDVTMSRPIVKKPTQSHTRAEFLRASDLTQQSQASVRPDSNLHSDLASGDQIRPNYEPNLGADILAAVVGLQKQQEEVQKSIQKEIVKKTNQIGKNIDAAQRRFELQQSEKLDKALKSMSDSQRKFQADSRAYSATATEQASGRIDRSIRHEIRNTVLPSLTRTLDPLRDQLHTTLAQKLTATDSVLKESLGKLVRSKDTLDAIGGAAGRAIQSQIHSAYKESFMQIVVPAFEKQCNMMFQQISGTFQRGMDDAVAKLEKQLQSRVKTELDRVGAMEKQTREATSALRDTAINLRSKITTCIEQEVQKLVGTEMKRAQESMLSEMSKTFKSQHEAAVKEQKAVLTECIRTTMAEIQPQHGGATLPGGKSLPGTPKDSPGPPRPTFEMQQQAILTQLHQGNINGAFQRALTASNLSLVMYVCEMVDPSLVFGTTPCSLHQPIILSLIQQLSCDLGRSTLTKLRYLQEAVMNLDHSHQVTQEHMHTVLNALVKNLDGHVATLAALPTDASNTPIIKQMKMLSMAAKSLIQDPLH